MSFAKKKKKESKPWRADILVHHKRKSKTRAERGEFPLDVVNKLKELSGGKCTICLFSKCTQTHHVYLKSRGGRGVITNGARVCNHCHRLLHDHAELLDKLIEKHRRMYGEFFWYDEQDFITYGIREEINQ